MPHNTSKARQLGQSFIQKAGSALDFPGSPGRLGREVVPQVRELGSAIGAASGAKRGLESQQRNERLSQRIQKSLEEGKIDEQTAQRLSGMLPKIQRPKILDKVEKEGTLGFTQKRVGTAVGFTASIAGAVSAAQQISKLLSQMSQSTQAIKPLANTARQTSEQSQKQAQRAISGFKDQLKEFNKLSEELNRFFEVFRNLPPTGGQTIIPPKL